MNEGDTIAAIATAHGEGALAVVRASGPDCPSILGAIFRAASGMPSTPRRTCFGRIHDRGTTVDQVLVTTFKAPASFTGEDMFEISCHGGVLLAARILQLVLGQGARAAEPGEFARRAFINGKMDLTRAEAIMDLISARTPVALRAAARQLEGGLGDKVAALRADTLTMVAHIEAWIDFPEEGIDPATGASLAEGIDAIRSRIEALLATADEGRILREGVRVAISGPPNAGKSSLLNRLLGMDRAITSEIPGTTRDTIEETVVLRGILFRIIDTAGLRDTEDPVERLGVDRALRAVEDADLVLRVVDATTPEARTTIPSTGILVWNKADLMSESEHPPEVACPVSALTGAGLDDLVSAMVARAGADHLASAQSPEAINARHQALLDEASRSLGEALGLVRSDSPPELAAVHLRAALDALGRIAGSADTEEILGEIFSRFCIGK
jgi:tRNA modification GTPase